VARQVGTVHKVHKVHKVLPVLKEIQSMDLKVLLDLKVLKDLLALQEILDNQVRMAAKVPKVPKALLEHPVVQDLMVLKVLKVQV
jgi:hypothetical protein